MQLQVFFHELIHAIDERAGTGLREKQIDALSYGLIDLFRDNPWLHDVLK
jgi:hypothetical protein